MMNLKERGILITFLDSNEIGKKRLIDEKLLKKAKI